MPRKYTRRSRKRRTSTEKISSVRKISIVLLFFALLAGWLYANFLLMKNQIYPNMIAPISAKIASSIIDKERKTFTRKGIDKFTTFVASISTLLSAFLEAKWPHSKSMNSIYLFLLAAWALWIKKFNRPIGLSIPHENITGQEIYKTHLTDQDLVKYSIEFAGIMATALALPIAELNVLAGLQNKLS